MQSVHFLHFVKMFPPIFVLWNVRGPPALKEPDILMMSELANGLLHCFRCGCGTFLASLGNLATKLLASGDAKDIKKRIDRALSLAYAKTGKISKEWVIDLLTDVIVVVEHSDFERLMSI